MHIPTFVRRLTLPVGAVLLVTACAGGSSAGWTYAPLGPTADPSAAATAGPSTPAGSGGPGTTLSIETTQAAPVSFTPAELTAPASATVTVNYNNNSNQPHNINFFDGQDQNAPSLGASTTGTGPNNPQTVTFTAPSEAGDYFFWCDVHLAQMSGILHVE